DASGSEITGDYGTPSDPELGDGHGAGGIEGLPERGEGSRGDRLAHPGHQALVMAQIVQSPQHRAEHLVAAVQVAQVAAAEAVAAGVAVATLLDRPDVALIHRIADAHGAR